METGNLQNASYDADGAGDAGHNLQDSRKAVDDAAAVVGGLWLSYLFLLFYLAIAVAAVTHIDLLLQQPIKLPFLSIELPLLAFFAVAPILFIITHAHTLVHFVLLAGKIGSFRAELYRRFPPGNPLRATQERQLPNNLFVQFLGGPEEVRKGQLGLVLKMIAWITLVMSPILLLLLLQIRFLPYHDLGITWLHRVVVIADILLVWALWPAVLEGRSRIRRPDLMRAKMATLASVMTVWFSCFVLTFPGEWQNSLPTIDSLSLHKALFAGPLDEVLRRSESPLTNVLVLPSLSILDAQKIDDPKKVEWRSTLINLRGRQLQGAILISADLARADLTGAQLQGAILTTSKLQGALIDGASLEGASLDEAELQGASLARARLQNAVLNKAQLQGAKLDLANLTDATLDDAQLQGATLEFAILRRASLVGTELRGASLRYSTLQDATFNSTKMSSVDLSSTYYWPKAFDTAVLNSVRCAEVLRIRPLPPENPPPVACKPIPNVPTEAHPWLAQIAGASVDEAVYGKSLAEALFRFVCSEKANSIDILHGIVRNKRIEDTKDSAPALIELITGSTCPLAAKLTSDDVAKLKAIGAH